MIGAGWTALFGIIQALDPTFEAVTQTDGTIIEYPIWPIAADESRKLGDATAGQLATLPAARRKSLAKFLNEYAPGIILAGALYEVAGPRLRYSLAVKKAQRERTMAANRAAAAGYRTGGADYARNGAARPAQGPPDPVPSAGERNDGPGTPTPANAHANGAARAFDADAELGRN